MTMRSVRPLAAVHPLLFGKRVPACATAGASEMPSALEDLKLFATSFAAGFLFVSVLIF